MKSTNEAEIRKILQEIEASKGSKSGGSGGENSFIMRKPELYWDLGTAIQKALMDSKISEDKKRYWIRTKTKKLQEEIFGGTPSDENKLTCLLAYNFVDELQDQKHFMFVADLAGHKFELFNRKFLEYIYRIFSKKAPQYTKSKLDNLAKKLLERRYTHDEYNKILKEFRGKTKISWYEVESSHNMLLDMLDRVIEKNEEDRKLLRDKINSKLIEQLRLLLQLLQINDNLLFQQIIDKNKAMISKVIKSNIEEANKFYKILKHCIKNESTRKKLMDVINPYEIGQLQTKLWAIQNEENYKEYMETKDMFQNIFKS